MTELDLGVQLLLGVWGIIAAIFGLVYLASK